MRTKKSIFGFSLLELLIVLAVLMIVVGIGVPNYQQMIANHRSKAMIWQLYYAIQLAKTEAIKRHTYVTICGSVDGVQCHRDWSKGYVVFSDSLQTGVLRHTRQRIKIFNRHYDDGQLIWKGFPNKTYLRFNALGFTDYQNGTFSYVLKSNKQVARKLVISQSGRVRI